MSEEIELTLLKEIEQLKIKILNMEGIEENKIPTYQFSKISMPQLKKLVNIKQKSSGNYFDTWFNNKNIVDNDTNLFFQELIDNNKELINAYNEEDLKIKFLAPLLNKVKFTSTKNEFRDFYELPLLYKTDEFILNGTTDFVVSKGLFESGKPYFFIQKFKKGQTNAYPESQLLAELVTATELNGWESIKGAYVVGASWYFVILKRLKKHTYHYFVSQSFDSTKIQDLQNIYTNLLFIKNEITQIIEKEELLSTS